MIDFCMRGIKFASNIDASLYTRYTYVCVCIGN